MTTLDKPTFSKEKINEITEYVKSILFKDPDEVNKLTKTSSKHCKMITEFYMLDKTDLHKAFENMIIEYEKKQKQKKAEWKLLGMMKNNKAAFIREHGIEGIQYQDVKYQIIDRFFIWVWDTSDEILRIAIPYYSPQSQRDKFWYWIIVYKSKTPNLFERLSREMKKYEGNAYISSNRK